MSRTTAAVVYAALLAASVVSWFLGGIVKGWAP